MTSLIETEPYLDFRVERLDGLYTVTASSTSHHWVWWSAYSDEGCAEDDMGHILTDYRNGRVNTCCWAQVV